MSDNHGQEWASELSELSRRGSWPVVVLALIIGIAIGRVITSGTSSAIAADPNADATATRTAELIELNDLRTQVAQPVVCTPPATPTNTPTPVPTATPTLVPVTPMGQKISYSNVFSITVTSASDIGSPGGLSPDGRFIGVNVAIENATDSGQWPPFDEWRLVDSAGKRYQVDVTATQAVFGAGWGLKVAPNSTENSGVVFDVPAGSGDSFVLESETQPTFRVEVKLQVRG